MHIPTVQPGDQPERGPYPDKMPLPGGAIASTRLVAQPAPLAGQVLKGTLLTILTLGIYRFWYRTRLRRYYWNNTRLLEDGFEYTGTGRELFIGFLIALAIIIPISIATSVLPWIFGPVAGAVISSIVSSLLLPVLFQIFLFRARRYRLARTRYRGVRFSQGGSGMGYLWVTIKWLIPTVLTLGIMFPYLRTALERYRINNTYFGTQKGAFSAKAGPLMWPWIAILITFVLAGGVMLFLTVAATKLLNNPVFAVMSVGVVIVTLLIVSILWCYFRAAEFRNFTSHTRFGAVQLSSDVTGGGIMRGFIGYAIGFVLLLAAIGAVFALLASGRGGLAALDHSPLAPVMGIGLVLIFFIGHAILMEVLLKRRMWKIFATSITVMNTPALQEILNSSVQETSGFGEAFDTSYDFAS